MYRTISILFFLLVLVPFAPAQNASPNGGSMALAPARFELEMKPGTETTVVLNLDYRSADDMTKPARIVASLNDWNISRDGRVEYFPANTRPHSESPWLIYSPGEASILPGTVHQIRVTVSVPINAVSGDYLTALIVEQRPSTLKQERGAMQMVVKYRMASVFYVKVAGLTKKGNLENLYAESTPDGIIITPVLKNEGNSVIRPAASVTVVDAKGKTIADLPRFDSLPILAGSELTQPLLIQGTLSPGKYSVRYNVDFGDGRPATEGVTDLVVKGPERVAALETAPKNP